MSARHPPHVAAGGWAMPAPAPDDTRPGGPAAERWRIAVAIAALAGDPDAARAAIGLGANDTADVLVLRRLARWVREGASIPADTRGVDSGLLLMGQAE